MLAEIGFTALTFAFVASVYAVIASVYGELKFSNRFVISGRNAALATLPLLTIATGANRPHYRRLPNCLCPLSQ